MDAVNHYIENSKILYYCKIDLEGNYTYVSPYFEEIFKCKSEDLIGISSLETIYHEDHQKTKDIVVKCFENPNTYQQAILRKPIKNGKMIWTQWEFYLNTNEKNEPTEIICYGHNLTKRVENLGLLKVANRKIENSEIKYKTLFETFSLGIILHSPDGVLYNVNEAFCNIVNLNKDEIINYNISKFTSDEYLESDKVFVNDLVTKGSTYTYEKEFLRNALEKVPVSITGKTFKDEEGNVLIWCIAKDITERKTQEKILSDQKEILEQTTHIAKLGGWEINLKTFKTEWTEEVYNIHDLDKGYDHNLLNGIAFYHPDDQDFVATSVNKAINEGIRFDIEVRFISSKHIHKWLRVIGEPVFNNNKIISVKGIIQDITERKKAEEIITKQNGLLKDISFTQSHLVRIPVANILGLIDLLDLVNSEDEKNNIYQKIKLSVNQLDSIISEVANKKITD